MVEMCFTWSKSHTAAHTEEVNWVPRSEVITSGTPKRDIQPCKRARAQAEAVIEDRGNAYG
jgi:hypothetical protein